MRAFLIVVLFLATSSAISAQTVDPRMTTARTRFQPPAGFLRREYRVDSFQYYLLALPLKKYGSPVLLWDGREKSAHVHASVIDMPILDKDLIQCADAIMKLRSEWQFAQRRFDSIAFTITNGMNVPFKKFAEGFRVTVKGNVTSWVKNGALSGRSKPVFDEYLEFIYAYAGTLSLETELLPVSIAGIEPGDVFIQGGTPGHAVIVIDVAENRRTGQKLMLLAQSFMPSQEIHILKSFTTQSPWYAVEDEILVTPEWTFKKGSLRRFPE